MFSPDALVQSLQLERSLSFVTSLFLCFDKRVWGNCYAKPRRADKNTKNKTVFFYILTEAHFVAETPDTLLERWFLSHRPHMNPQTLCFKIMVKSCPCAISRICSRLRAKVPDTFSENTTAMSNRGQLPTLYKRV